MDYNKRFSGSYIQSKTFDRHENEMLRWINDNKENIDIINIYVSQRDGGSMNYNPINVFHVMYSIIPDVEKITRKTI